MYLSAFKRMWDSYLRFWGLESSFPIKNYLFYSGLFKTTTKPGRKIINLTI